MTRLEFPSPRFLAALQASQRHGGNEVCSHKGSFLRLELGLPPCHQKLTVLINNTGHIPFSIENVCSNGLVNLITLT